MVEAAQVYLQYTVVLVALQEGGQWLEGTSGIHHFREHLLVVDGIVVIHGRSVVLLSLRSQVFECLHLGHQ